MEIMAFSDTHGMIEGLRDKIRSAVPDVVVIAGDVSPCKSFIDPMAYLKGPFFDLVRWCPRSKFIMVPGNHDLWAVDDEYLGMMKIPKNFKLLRDTGYIYKGVRFWGSPWVPKIHGRWAFESLEEDESDIRGHFGKIPGDVEVLITHSPPLIEGSDADLCLEWEDRKQHFGSAVLGDLYREGKIHPKVHICGHIHSGDHRAIEVDNGTDTPTMLYNVARVSERYEVKYEPTVITI